MRQIAAEYAAVQRVFNEPSMVAPHEFITQRQVNIAGHVHQLRGLVGDEQAMALLRENDEQMVQKEAEQHAATQTCLTTDSTDASSAVDIGDTADAMADTSAPSA